MYHDQQDAANVGSLSVLKRAAMWCEIYPVSAASPHQPPWSGWANASDSVLPSGESTGVYSSESHYETSEEIKLMLYVIQFVNMSVVLSLRRWAVN
jgi:hypothetical protein